MHRRASGDVPVSPILATESIFSMYYSAGRKQTMSITLTGTIPVGGKPVVILEANPGIGSGCPLKFKFSAPLPDAEAPVPYTLSFCIGPAANPCGLPTDFVVVVPGGQERLAVVDGGTFKNNVLVVGQGTSVPIPFSVTIE
jgi:hypothetical protein